MRICRRAFIKLFSISSVAAGVTFCRLDRFVLSPRVAEVAGQALTIHEYATVRAIASRIIPSEPDYAGATEANVVNFIDNILSNVTDYRQRSKLPEYQAGVVALDAASGGPFISLTEARQDSVLMDCEDGVNGPDLQIFFNLVMKHSWEGFLALPKYGGNADKKGWAAIGSVVNIGHNYKGSCNKCHDFGNPALVN